MTQVNETPLPVGPGNGVTSEAVEQSADGPGRYNDSTRANAAEKTPFEVFSEYCDEKEGRVRLPNLSKSFWEARPYLQQIRAAAHSRGAAPDLVLCALMSRLSSMVSHDLQFKTVLGPGSLNLFVAAVGRSSGGKSSGARVSRVLLTRPAYLGEDFRDGLVLGSGEGLAEAFMGEKWIETGQTLKNGKPERVKVRVQVRHNVFMFVDEGEGLIKQAGRAGSTVGPILRSAWTGETLGQANASAETTRYVPENSYALGLLIGFQYKTVQPMFAESSAGTPQRFLWCSTEDPGAPEMPPEWPGELEVKLAEARFGMARTGMITFPDAVNKEIWGWRLAKLHGRDTSAELDSHMSLMLCKVAALLAVLDGRFTVNEEDWQLAKRIWEMSCGIRDALVEFGHREVSEATRKKEDSQIKFEARKRIELVDLEEIIVDDKTQKVAVRIATKVHEKGPTKRRDIMNKFLASGDRQFFADAIQRAEEKGWLVYDYETNTATPGGSRPAPAK